MVVDKATIDKKRSSMGISIHTDGLVLMTESRAGSDETIRERKRRNGSKRIGIGLGKKKTSVTGKGTNQNIQSGSWPFGCCGRE